MLAYDVIHRARDDAVVTTNNSSLSIYEYDRMLVDVLLSRSAGVARQDVDEWIGARRHRHDSLLPDRAVRERLLRKASTLAPPRGPALYGASSGRGRGTRPEFPRRALDSVYESPHERTLDVLGIDYYDPMAGRHFRLPGHRTAGGRNPLPTRELWDDPPDPSGLGRWLGIEHDRAPDLPIWVVENGLCNRVRNGRAYYRLDGWDRPRYLRENLAAVVEARDEGVPVTGYWHWSLVDNYEWGSYEPALRHLRGRPPPRRARRALARDRLDGPRRPRRLPADRHGAAQRRPERARGSRCGSRHGGPSSRLKSLPLSDRSSPSF